MNGDSIGGFSVSVSGAGNVSARVRLEIANDPGGPWVSDAASIVSLSGICSATTYLRSTTHFEYIRAVVESISAGASVSVFFGDFASSGTGFYQQDNLVFGETNPLTGRIKTSPGIIVYDESLQIPFVQLESGVEIPVSVITSVSNVSLPGLGNPISRYKSTGVDFDFALDATGNATAGTWGTVPADAIALEVWCNTSAAGDYLFFASRTGQLSAAGVLATNISNNTGGTNPNGRFVVAGAKMVIPLSAIGAVDSTFRFAGSKATGRCQGRYITSNAAFPYKLASAEEWTIAGAGASAQMPYTNTAKFPASTVGTVFQIKGASGTRIRYDGGSPTATAGELLEPGYYFLDYARHGIAASALRFYVPSGVWISGNTLVAA